MDGVHVVDECLHRLVYAVDGAVDGVLLEALIALQEDKVCGDIILNLSIVQVLQVHTGEVFDILDLFDVALAHIGGEVEVEGRDGLSAMHLVLHRLHRDTCHDRGGLDTLCGAALAMSGLYAMLEHLI